MNDYYSQHLSGERLRLCYEVAPARVKRYLEAEIDFVFERTRPHDRVLELGCGYGRVLRRLVRRGGTTVGIDTSLDNLRVANAEVGDGCLLALMDAAELGLRPRQFDLVCCVQNGISAFNVDQRRLFQEALRVTRPGGTVLFSSYSERFWEDRLEWFRIQSEEGLIGEIDFRATGNGRIVCKDGFTAGTLGPEDFISLASSFDLLPRITEVDGSSIFCELTAA